MSRIQRSRCVAIKKIWKPHADFYILTRFQNIPCLCYISRQSCKTKMFLLLYSKVIPPDTLSQQFWKFLEQTKETLTVVSVLAIVIGGLTGLLKFFKMSATKDVLLIIFENFQNRSFCNILQKYYEVIFLEAFS